MTGMPFIAVGVAWCVASAAVLAIRGKQLSRMSCGLIILGATIGAGTVQFVLFRGGQALERESAAQLAGVTSLRLKDDAEFIQQYLVSLPEKNSNVDGGESTIDWSDTFRMKAEDISETLAAIDRNDFLRRYHSVWLSDVEFNRHQLDQLATRMPTDAAAQRSLAKHYRQAVIDAADRLQRLAQELRK